MYVRTCGGVCFPLPMPSTGSIPSMAENGDFVVVEFGRRATAKAVFPPRLCPERTSLDRLGRTPGGRRSRRPSGNQSVIAAVELISSVVSGPATV